MDKQKTDRLNALAAAARERELSAEEQAERETLRQEYREAFRASLRQTLEHTVIEQPDGTKTPLQKKKP